MSWKIKEYLRTDLIQAKILEENSKLSYFKLFFLFIKSHTSRIHLFVRLRQSNSLFSALAKFYLSRYFIEIGKQTHIGKFFYMPHPRGIILANNVVLGNHVHVGQYVTIGGSFKKSVVREDGSIQKLPILGSHIVVASGSVIGGPVKIGDHIIISANSTVTKDVSSHKIVKGVNEISTKNILLFDFCGQYKYIN